MIVLTLICTWCLYLPLCISEGFRLNPPLLHSKHGGYFSSLSHYLFSYLDLFLLELSTNVLLLELITSRDMETLLNYLSVICNSPYLQAYSDMIVERRKQVSSGIEATFGLTKEPMSVALKLFSPMEPILCFHFYKLEQKQKLCWMVLLIVPLLVVIHVLRLVWRAI